MSRVVEEVQALLALPGAEGRPGAPAEEVDELEEWMGAQLPGEVRELFLATDGADLCGWRLLGVESARELARHLPPAWDYLPLLDCVDSNPWCVACREPLAGRIVRVAHDGEARLAFRNVADLLQAARAGLERMTQEQLPEPPPGERPAAPPSGWGEIVEEYGPHDAADAACGLALLELAGQADTKLDYQARVDAIRFATQLLGPEHVPQLARFADHGWAGPEVCAWLARQGTPAARDALARRQLDLEAFAWRCAQALRRSGFVILRMRPDGLIRVRRKWRLLGERHWFDAGKLLDRRAEPGLMDEIVERIRRW